MAELMAKFEPAPAKLWQWRDRDGGFHYPHKMETRHLFYTLRMIWNHTMPAFAHVGRNRHYYNFGSFYTADYMKVAVVHLAAELAQRTDMRADWKLELNQMRSFFDKELQIIEKSYQMKHLTKQPGIEP